MKQTRMNRIFFLLSAIVMSFFSSCSPYRDIEDTPQYYDGETHEVIMKLKHTTLSVDLNEIETVRAIVFSNGEQVSNTLYGKIDANSKLLVKAATGTNDFYFICNETEAMSEQLTKVMSEEEIEKVRLETKDIGQYAPMYGEETEVKVTIARTSSGAVTYVQKKTQATPSTEMEVTAKRMLAKISMTVIKDLTNSPYKFTLEDMSYKICRLPAYTTVQEGVVYTEKTLWADDIRANGTGTLIADGKYAKDGEEYKVESGDFITFPDVYVPEHILSTKEDRSECTYMMITAKCKLEGASSTTDVVYRLDLGKNAPTDLDLERNVNYRIYATIKSKGASGFHANIVPIDEYNIPVTWKSEGYVIVSERETEYNKNANIWNDYSQYSGILKIAKDKVFYSALFRYGSVVAVKDNTAATPFTTADILWKPGVTPASSWDNIGYMDSGDITNETQTLDNIKAGKGDPCRLVGLTETEIASGTVDNKLWRTPTKDEMAWISTARNDEINANGFHSFYWLLTPNSGSRAADGTMIPSNADGNYWTATDRNSFRFNSTDNNASFSESADPKQAYAIRCVRVETPPSRFGISGDGQGYTGATGQTLLKNDNYLVPFWKVTLLGTDAEKEGITFTKWQGSVNEAPTYNLTPLPNPYQSRTFKVNVTGYGLDGVVHEVKGLTINQNRLIHTVELSLDPAINLPIVNGYRRIPQEGIKLSYSIKISPDPISSYYDVNSMRWHITAKWHSDKEYSIDGSSANMTGKSEITIPANEWGHIIAVDISCRGESPFPLYTESTFESVRSFIQEKKSKP